MKRLFPLLAFALGACAAYADGPLVDGGPIRQDGQAARPADARRPVVAPLKVVEDSRCPVNARCVWAGRLSSAPASTERAGARPRDLELGQP